MRETSIHRIEGGEVYEYPQWYYDSKDEAKRKHICHYCGQPLPKGKRAYCSEDCRTHWVNWAGINSLKTNSLRREVHKKYGFACTNCGEVFCQTHESGVDIPRFYGHVHHIVPLHEGGLDVFKNLTLLCEDCHKAVHGGRVKY